MSVNKYEPHLLVLPEDDHNRQIVDGFVLDLNCNLRAIQILPVAKGWPKVVGKFNSDYAPEMRKLTKRRIVLLMDFDGKPENRKSFAEREIPEDIRNRVFVLGVCLEPKDLKNATRKNYEEIGAALAKDCAENKQDFWMHDLLKHNEPELHRLIEDVRPFLFK